MKYIYLVRVYTKHFNGEMVTAFSSETKAKAYTNYLKDYFKENEDTSVRYTKEPIFTSYFWNKKEGK